ncbi:hypothetical protein [Sigmofec virus UA08Rod_4967]|uniref:Uncharacterized protein n=1 Tax=Sigmofec virus UA08Rod_4967 TaxID=2929413 RepID=A0A976N1Z6_9VIRU|nr:hypothetical protein [Sigmofec virus UA08Rod_4967]
MYIKKKEALVIQEYSKAMEKMMQKKLEETDCKKDAVQIALYATRKVANTVKEITANKNNATLEHLRKINAAYALLSIVEESTSEPCTQKRKKLITEYMKLIGKVFREKQH